MTKPFFRTVILQFPSCPVLQWEIRYQQIDDFTVNWKVRPVQWYRNVDGKFPLLKWEHLFAAQLPMRLRTGTCHGPPREFWLPSFERWGRDFIEIAMWWTSNTVLDTLYHTNLQPSAFAGGCFALASIPMDLNWINWVFTDFTGSVPKSAAFPVAFRKLSYIGRKQDRRERRRPQWTVEPGTQRIDDLVALPGKPPRRNKFFLWWFIMVYRHLFQWKAINRSLCTICPSFWDMRWPVWHQEAPKQREEAGTVSDCVCVSGSKAVRETCL